MNHNTFGKTSGTGLRIGIVRARFNEDITAGLLAGAMEALGEAGVLASSVKIIEVPGSFEVPLAADRLFATKAIDAVVCLGALIQGETPHFEYISRAVASGLMQVGLRHGKPCVFGVITCFTREQAEERSGPGEMNRGREAAKVALEMVDTVRRIA
jgi:6,7-dimethyl-8-ribityllumazine synthase